MTAFVSHIAYCPKVQIFCFSWRYRERIFAVPTVKITKQVPNWKGQDFGICCQPIAASVIYSFVANLFKLKLLVLEFCVKKRHPWNDPPIHCAENRVQVPLRNHHMTWRFTKRELKTHYRQLCFCLIAIHFCWWRNYRSRDRRGWQVLKCFRRCSCRGFCKLTWWAIF